MKLPKYFRKGLYCSGAFWRMAFWSDNISNVSDEELGKDELFLDNILAKDLSMPKRSPWSQDGGTGTGDGLQELDLSMRSAKLSCMVGDGDPAMLEDLVDPKKSGKEKRLLNIFQRASRATDYQCDLEVNIKHYVEMDTMLIGPFQ